MEQNWKVFVVDDLQEAMAVSTAGEKRLIFLDDFLGQISLTNRAGTRRLSAGCVPKPAQRGSRPRPARG